VEKPETNRVTDSVKKKLLIEFTPETAERKQNMG
jgi:hypothetical protein